ncbi:MAG: FAD-dependent oxidoreductase [Chloroflexi bacterium]|nr:FAD-dependent oxidoreductase [Chloroflexota bacterium]
MFEHLFQPIKIGKFELKNRLFCAPTQTFVNNNDGTPTDMTFELYESRCSGGWGLVPGEATYFRDDGKPYWNFLGCAHDGHVPGLSRIADIMHKHGLPACMQFVHAGRTAQKVVTGLTPVAPSAPLPDGGVVDYPPDGSNKPRAMTTMEVEQLIDDYVAAVMRLKKAGYDMFLWHGAHGFIFNQFQAHYTNHRTDKYGDPTTFTVEVIRKTREAVGPDFALGMRMNGSDFFPGGITIEQSVKMAPVFEKSGLDWIDVSAGARERIFMAIQPLYFPRGVITDLAAAIKKVVNIPVVTAGRINDPRLAEDIIARGKADIVSLCRGVIADPEFAIKTREGRTDEIRRCMGCDLCMGFTMLLSEATKCAENYDAGRPGSQTEIKAAAAPKKVMVAGGGVGGMELARIACLRGHHVTLYEKESKLGGSVASMASRIPHLNTRDLINSVLWLTNEMKRLKIKVVTGTEVTPEMVEKEKPDVVVLATGAVPALPKLPGIDGSNVIVLDDYLKSQLKTGQKVAVLGGGNGWETAISLRREGKEVTLIEESAEVGNAPYLTRQRKPALALFSRESQLAILTDTRVTEINKHGVVAVDKQGNGRLIEADTVLIALSRMPYNPLKQALEGKVKEVYSIGDCVEPKHTMHAIHGASELARKI